MDDARREAIRLEELAVLAEEARKAEDRIRRRIAEEEMRELCNKQNARISELGKQLAERGFKSVLFVILQRSTWTDTVNRELVESYSTFTTQFLCNIGHDKVPDLTRPHSGVPDWCFGLSEAGEVFVGFADNRLAGGKFDARGKFHYYAKVLIEVMEQRLSELGDATQGV